MSQMLRVGVFYGTFIMDPYYFGVADIWLKSLL